MGTTEEMVNIRKLYSELGSNRDAVNDVEKSILAAEVARAKAATAQMMDDHQTNEERCKATIQKELGQIVASFDQVMKGPPPEPDFKAVGQKLSKVKENLNQEDQSGKQLSKAEKRYLNGSSLEETRANTRTKVELLRKQLTHDKLLQLLETKTEGLSEDADALQQTAKTALTALN